MCGCKSYFGALLCCSWRYFFSQPCMCSSEAVDRYSDISWKSEVLSGEEMQKSTSFAYCVRIKEIKYCHTVCFRTVYKL